MDTTVTIVAGVAVHLLVAGAIARRLIATGNWFKLGSSGRIDDDACYIWSFFWPLLGTLYWGGLVLGTVLVFFVNPGMPKKKSNLPGARVVK